MTASQRGSDVQSPSEIGRLLTKGVPLHQIEQWLDQLENEQTAINRRHAAAQVRSSHPTIKGQPADVASGRYDVAW